MPMNTTPDVLSGSDLESPSGSEVYSAAFHPTVDRASTLSSHKSGFRGRLDTFKSRGLEKIRGSKELVSTRTSTMKRSVRNGVSRQMTQMESSMRTSPMKWVAVAAGSGFALG